MIHMTCPHCADNGIHATLQEVVTARGDVCRCWQCGGEYVAKLVRVWPQVSGTKSKVRSRK